MKTIHIIFILLFLTGVISCKKKEDTYVKVTVHDMGANRNVPGKHLILYVGKRINQWGSHHYSYDLIAEKDTDVNGIADFGGFEAYKDKDYIYYVAFEDGNNLKESEYIVNKGEDNNITINVKGRSSLTVNFTPPPPYSVGDSLRVEFYGSNYAAYTHPIITNSTYQNNHQFFVYYDTYYFNIDKYKAGVYTNVKDTVFYDDDSVYTYNVNW